MDRCERGVHLENLKKFKGTDKREWQGEWESWRSRNWGMMAAGARSEGRRMVRYKPLHIRLMMSLSKGVM